MFSSRSIQRALDASGAYLAAKQRWRLLHRLNRPDAQSLHAQWEVMVLQAFTFLGAVKYEALFPGTTKPDLLFHPKGKKTPAFLADITTVSDQGLHDANPYNQLHDQFAKLLERHGLSMAGFRIDVQGKRDGEFGDAKMRLRLPKKEALTEFLAKEFGVFAAGVARNPTAPARHSLDRENAQITISYDPTEKRFSSGGHPTFTIAYSLSKNPVANALKDKADQMVKSGHPGPHGVVLCDGGCDLLHQDGHYSSAGTYTLEKVLGDVFTLRPTLGFVLVLTTEKETRPLASPRAPWVGLRLYRNPQAPVPLGPEAESLLGDLGKHFPVPVRSSRETVVELRHGMRKQGDSFAGAHHYAEKKFVSRPVRFWNCWRASNPTQIRSENCKDQWEPPPWRPAFS